MEEDASLQAQIFHNTVRENIIFLLLFFLLYGSSYVIIRRFRRRDRDDYFTSDEDEATVFKISLWMCTFSLAVSVGAALLLPISIVSNEVLLLYPNSYYVQWLNSSLIQGLWNHVFLFSNLSLFILLPFAYLFTESEGFTGYRKGLMARVYETFIVLSLMAVLVLGMTSIMSALIDKDKSSIITLLNFWTYYLPFLYSCMSFIGVVMLSICTPLGFVRLFDVVGQFLVKPQFLRDLDEEYFVARMEEESLERRIIAAQRSGVSYQQPPPMHTEGFAALHNGALQTSLSQRLANARITRKTLDNQRQTSVLRRNLLYPVAMLLLFALTVITVLMVLQNTLLLLIGIKALPLSSKQFTLGISSLSKLGRLGAALEVIIIFYLVITSSIGLYTLPLLSRVRPRMRRTPFTHVIVNCILVLILSSALPLLSRILGITDFDLLGDFGRIEWLGNFKIVLLYNLVFAGAATLCLINKFTATVRRELYARLKGLISWLCDRDGNRAHRTSIHTKED